MTRLPGGRWLAQPAPRIPAWQPCLPALQLKSIIQIILAWWHGSVAVMNSSEARKGRTHAPLITVADVCFLPGPLFVPRPRPAPTSPGMSCPTDASSRARCIQPTLDGVAQLMGAQPSPMSPTTTHAASHYPTLPGPQITQSSLQRGKDDPLPKKPGLPWLWRAGERGCGGAGWMEPRPAPYPLAAPALWGPDPAFCWGKPPWARGAGAAPWLGQACRSQGSRRETGSCPASPPPRGHCQSPQPG